MRIKKYLVKSYLRVLSAKCAGVSSMLGNLHLLDNLTQGGTITGAVLAHNTSLLGVLSLNIDNSKIRTNMEKNKLV